METDDPRPEEPALIQLVFNKDTLISFESFKQITKGCLEIFIMGKLMENSKLRSQMRQTIETVLNVKIESIVWHRKSLGTLHDP